MSPSYKAKMHGARSLTAVADAAEVNMDTIRRIAKSKPRRFKALCIGALCEELGLTGQELRDYVKLKQSIEGK